MYKLFYRLLLAYTQEFERYKFVTNFSSHSVLEQGHGLEATVVTQIKTRKTS